MRNPVLLLLAAMFLVAGCANNEEGPFPIPDSTYWISAPEQGKKTEITLKVYTSAEQCRAAFGADAVADCTPRVDRSTGQVRLAFETIDKETGTSYPLPLQQEHVRVSHNKSPVETGAKSGFQLIQHGEKRWSQLFIVLIDGSGSMYDNDEQQLKKVWTALNDKKVKDAFFPSGVQNGVVLLRFTSKVESLDGGPIRVLQGKKAYDTMIQSLRGPRGFTHLYDAVGFAADKLIEEPEIKKWLQINDRAEPTIVALTDGFNNQAGSDRCGDNAPRLQRLLEDIEVARNKPLGQRPTIYTIGLGKAYRQFGDVPLGRVSERDLCGKYSDYLINGQLETVGIDNPSLKWIAARGGGQSFVKNNAAGLAEVFQEAASKRYEWYEVRYRVDPFYHRQAFETRIQLTSYANAVVTQQVFPGAWLDGPTPKRAEGSVWSEPQGMRATFGLVMPIFGGLMLIAFFGPAGYNARRAVFRRERGSAPPPAPGAAPPQGEPPQS